MCAKRNNNNKHTNKNNKYTPYGNGNGIENMKLFVWTVQRAAATHTAFMNMHNTRKFGSREFKYEICSFSLFLALYLARSFAFSLSLASSLNFLLFCSFSHSPTHTTTSLSPSSHLPLSCLIFLLSISFSLPLFLFLSPSHFLALSLSLKRKPVCSHTVLNRETSNWNNWYLICRYQFE